MERAGRVDMGSQRGEHHVQRHSWMATPVLTTPIKGSRRQLSFPHLEKGICSLVCEQQPRLNFRGPFPWPVASTELEDK